MIGENVQKCLLIIKCARIPHGSATLDSDRYRKTKRHGLLRTLGEEEEEEKAMR